MKWKDNLQVFDVHATLKKGLCRIKSSGCAESHQRRHGLINWWIPGCIFMPVKTLTSKCDHDDKRILIMWLAVDNNKKQQSCVLEFETSGSWMKGKVKRRGHRKALQQQDRKWIEQSIEICPRHFISTQERENSPWKDKSALAQITKDTEGSYLVQYSHGAVNWMPGNTQVQSSGLSTPGERKALPSAHGNDSLWKDVRE